VNSRLVGVFLDGNEIAIVPCKQDKVLFYNTSKNTSQCFINQNVYTYIKQLIGLEFSQFNSKKIHTQKGEHSCTFT